jgi:hypothetical protein
VTVTGQAVVVAGGVVQNVTASTRPVRAGQLRPHRRQQGVEDAALLVGGAVGDDVDRVLADGEPLVQADGGLADPDARGDDLAGLVQVCPPLRQQRGEHTVQGEACVGEGERTHATPRNCLYGASI